MVVDCLICRLVIEAWVNSIQVTVGIGAGMTAWCDWHDWHDWRAEVETSIVYTGDWVTV